MDFEHEDCPGDRAGEAVRHISEVLDELFSQCSLDRDQRQGIEAWEAAAVV